MANLSAEYRLSASGFGNLSSLQEVLLLFLSWCETLPGKIRRKTLTIPAILQCPISGCDLSFAEAAHIAELRTRIAQGVLRHATGAPVRMQLEAALLSSDGRFAYPIVDGILILLPSLALVMPGETQAAAGVHLAADTDSVMRFYDEVGWQSSKDAGFQDAELFEDFRPVSSAYIHKCHMRVNDDLLPQGKYFLDVASGPVQYGEYLSYSERYEHRICGDVSLTALKAAKQKLGGKGIYIQCDITQLPLKSGSVDAFVSLHTIYHVPKERQALAFRELERVLKPGRKGAVVYTWGNHCLAMELVLHPIQVSKHLIKSVLPASVLGRLRKASGKQTSASAVGQTQAEPKLYYHPHDRTWFQREIASTEGWDVRVWRSVSVPFLKLYVRSKFLGKQLLSIVFWIENAAPHVCGKFGYYPLLVYRKPGSGNVSSSPPGT
jgi:ubiquinone/menaquinone biosynthesis C-methylase UbiE/uncharacterized protein YbaR (Trm112 family)